MFGKAPFFGWPWEEGAHEWIQLDGTVSETPSVEETEGLESKVR